MSLHEQAKGTTVVIPTWQRAPWLARCLAAVICQVPVPGEVVVVGRAEDEAAQRVVAEMAGRAPFPVRWVTVDQPGHVAPVRRGLDEAGGDIVAFLDDDAEPEAGWLARLLEPFSEPSVACVGGRVVVQGFRGKVKRDAGRVRWYGEYVGNVGALESPGPVEVDAVMEGNWAWRTEVLRNLSFDPVLDYGDAAMYGLDLCLQARARGYRVIYHPRARIIHHLAPRDPSLDRSAHEQRAFGYSRNYTYLGLKHFRGIRRVTFLVWWWAVGDSGSRGLLRALASAMRVGGRSLETFAAEIRGKLEGIRMWRG